MLACNCEGRYIKITRHEQWRWRSTHWVAAEDVSLSLSAHKRSTLGSFSGEFMLRTNSFYLYVLKHVACIILLSKVPLERVKSDLCVRRCVFMVTLSIAFRTLMFIKLIIRKNNHVTIKYINILIIFFIL